MKMFLNAHMFQFPLSIMIELYVKLTRSIDEILHLLNAHTTSNSS